MKTLLVFGTFLCLAFGAYGASLPYESRVVGGQAGTISDFPYQLSLQRLGSHFCGASYIGGVYAISAAHCVQTGLNLQNTKVVGGYTQYDDENRVGVSMSSWMAHPNYNSSGSFAYDFSIITMVSDLSSTSTVDHPIQKVAYASTEFDAMLDYTKKAVTSGWGKTGMVGGLPETLQWAALPLVTNAQCFTSYLTNIKPQMVCAGGDQHGSCNGDSGGPLVYYQNVDADNTAPPSNPEYAVLIGAVSFGRITCDPSQPTVYARIGSVATWILEETNIESMELPKSY